MRLPINLCRFYFKYARHSYTAPGYPGCGPHNTQKRDLICISPQIRVPVTLRKAGPHYHFVSACMVMGLMDGEASEMLKRGVAAM